MATNNYTCSFSVIQTPGEVFDAINNVGGWWTEDMEGETDKLNDEFKVSFGTTWKIFRIIDIVPGERIVWEVMDCCLPWNKNITEWTGTKVSFEMSEKDDNTQVSFTHIGLLPEHDCYEACSNAWGGYITNSLRNLIMTGEGQPNRKK